MTYFRPSARNVPGFFLPDDLKFVDLNDGVIFA